MSGVYFPTCPGPNFRPVQEKTKKGRILPENITVEPLGEVKKIIWFWSARARLLPPARSIFFIYFHDVFRFVSTAENNKDARKGNKNQDPACLIIPRG